MLLAIQRLSNLNTGLANSFNKDDVKQNVLVVPMIYSY